MKSALVLGLAVSVFAASSAFAQGAPSSPPSDPQQQPASQPTTVPATTEGESNREKMICKKVDVPGTRIGGKKVCKTKREWDQIQRDSADAARRTQDAGLRNNPTSASGN